ncbi:HK97 family phage prohead protease [Erysipelothrix anatis]|uniref:HK97 family phage prohead protease n=1 Tax=Erysipelothrix anatis TaxID=2683713 RepID=UPI00135C369F|nr:HK97 family phage prohead protease [Erysipelothrix anatis]
MEKRISYFQSDLKTRSESDEKILEGYFVVFNQETELWQGVYEEIAPSAVVNSLKTNDIRALFNHDAAIVLGRVGNQTLELKADEHGLYGRVFINSDDREANDIYARVSRGDINQCSFGFYPLEEEVQRDQERDTTKFIVKEADVIEVSIVAWGAYSTTEISARSRAKQVEDIKERERKAKLKEFRSKYGKESL